MDKYFFFNYENKQHLSRAQSVSGDSDRITCIVVVGQVKSLSFVVAGGHIRPKKKEHLMQILSNDIQCRLNNICF